MGCLVGMAKVWISGRFGKGRPRGVFGRYGKGVGV